jgi:hypothetical protein
MELVSVTRDITHELMSALNDAAETNMPRIFVTRETSHDPMSPLNAAAPENM